MYVVDDIDNNMTGEFGIKDLLTTVTDLMSDGRSMLSNTVFGNPNQAYSYDAIADSQKKLMDKVLLALRDVISGAPERRRTQAIADYTGTGGVGAVVADILSKLGSRDFIGHFGGDRAVNNIMQFANPMAIARGGSIGNLIDQRQLQQNLRMAAIEGGMAYNSFFNQDGSINIEQTKGVGLPTAGYIAGSVLADRSIRSSWAQEVMGQPMENGKYVGGLTKSDIENLKSGKGYSENALKSFGEYTKKFTAEINGFVASVSKMTGSYDEAINFLQRLTNGELFKDTERARRSRDRASVLATNIRLAAADAGISAKELYATTDAFSTAAATQLGMSSSDIVRGGGEPLTAMSGLSSIAYAKWRSSNPMASQERIAKAQMAVGDSVNAYVGSEQDQMNALAARLKSNGVDMSDYEENLKNGDAEKMKSILIEKYGRGNFMNYMDNKGLSWLDRQTYNEDYAKYAATSLSFGRSRDVIRAGTNRMFVQSVRDFSGSLSGGDSAKQFKIQEDMLKNYRQSLLSDEALSAAGITDKEQRDSIREWGKNKTVLSINERLNKLYGADAGDTIRRVAMQATGKYAEELSRKNVMSDDEEKSAIERILKPDADLGLSKEAQKSFQKNAKGKNIDQITELLGRYTVDPKKAKTIVEKFTDGKVSSRSGQSYKGLQRQIDRLAPRLTSSDIEDARTELAVEFESRKINDIAARALQGDTNAYETLASFKDGSILKRATDSKDYGIAGSSYISNLLSETYGLDDLSEDERSKMLKVANDAHARAVQRGASAEETKAEIDASLTKNGYKGAQNRKITASTRKKAMTRVFAETSSAALIEKIQGQMSKDNVTVDPEVRLLTKDLEGKDVRSIADKITKRMEKNPKETLEEATFAELKNAYKKHYQKQIEEGKITEEQGQALMNTLDTVIKDSGTTTVRESAIQAVRNSVYVTKDGIARNKEARSQITQQQAEARAVENKRSAEDRAEIAGNSANYRDISNVIGQYSKELVSPDDWRRAYASSTDRLSRQIITAADVKSALQENKQFATGGSIDAERVRGITAAIESKHADKKIVQLETLVKEKLGDKYRDVISTDGEAPKALTDLLENDEDVKKSVKQLEGDGFSKSGILASVRQVAKLREESNNDTSITPELREQKLEEAAKGGLVADKIAATIKEDNKSPIQSILEKIAGLLEKFTSDVGQDKKAVDSVKEVDRKAEVTKSEEVSVPSGSSSVLHEKHQSIETVVKESSKDTSRVDRTNSDVSPGTKDHSQKLEKPVSSPAPDKSYDDKEVVALLTQIRDNTAMLS